MKKSLLVGALLWAFLLVASPAPATIHVDLEIPSDLQDVSGIYLVSGWAFSTMPGTAVTVKLRINGATREDIPIPCCGPRQDVVDANPGAPLNSGFGLLLNYGVLDPATTSSVGVQVSAPGETPATVDHMVMIAKPGDAEFLTSFALGASANVAIDGNEIVIGGAQVSGSGTTKTNLRVNYAINSQSLVIGEAFTGTDATGFNAVQTIFTDRCALSGCHAGSSPVLGQDLSAGNAWKNIVAVRSVEDPSRPRVSPGDDERSYLYQKIIPDGAIIGARMPLTDCCLSRSEIQAIEDWINDGARPPP